MKERILEFILDYLQREYDLPEDADLAEFNFVETGYVDSVGLVEFVAVIEDEFEIEFTDEELQADGFKVIGSLVSMIQAKVEN